MRYFSPRKFLGDVIFVAVILLVIVRIFSDLPMPFSVIVSESMSPTLNKGDIVLVVPCDISNVKVGDIVVFKNGDKYIAHRAIAILEKNGEILVVTKGDANEYPDQYGPHVPLPFVTKYNLHGVVVTVLGVPVKIPYLGTFTTYLNKLRFPYVAPFLIAIIFLFAAVTAEPKHTKISLKRLFIFSFSIFIIISFATLIFAKNTYTFKVGVGVYAGDDAFNYIEPGSTIKLNLTLSNVGFTPMKCIPISKNCTIENREVFVISPEEHIDKSVVVRVPNDRGVYYVSALVYYSPFWLIIPDEIVKTLSEYDEYGVVALNILSSVIIATLATLITFVIVSVWEYLSLKSSIKKINRSSGGYLIINARRVHFPAILTSVASIIVAYFFGFSYGILAIILILPFVLYLAGGRWVGQYILGGFESTLLFLTYYTVPFVLNSRGLWSILLGAAATLLLFSIIGSIISAISVLLAKLITRIRRVKDPLVILEGDL